MAEEIKIIGLENVKNILRKLPARVEKNVLTAGVRAGANVVKTSAVNKLSGVAKKKDIVVQKRKSKKGQIKFSVGPSKEKWYLRFIESGTVPHWVRVQNRDVLSDYGSYFGDEIFHPGIRKSPFLRPAMDENTGKILQAMGTKMGAAIEKEAAKLGKK